METIILFAPLVGALLGGFGWKIMGETAAQWLTTSLLFLAAILSWVIMLTFDASAHDNGYYTIELMRWIQSGTLDTSWGIRMDRLTAIMLVVITTVSALVHLYSFGYMAHDENFGEGVAYKARFFAYLSFFTLHDVDAGDRRQPCADVLWLGRRGRRVLPFDRFLLQETVCQCRCDQGVRRQPCG
jgi:NADH-quinone oxidoreductase subunit L